MKRTRGYRRNRKFIQRRKAEKYLRSVMTISAGDSKAMCVYYADNITKCSCQMCRNPRHSNFSKGKTRISPNEYRASQDDISELRPDIY